MKARVRATGEIVEARRICQSSQGPIWEAEGSEYYEYELDFDIKEPTKPPYTPDYWTRLEHTYAGMAMQRLMSKEYYLDNPDSLVSHAIHYAHALVEKLQKKEEDNESKS